MTKRTSSRKARAARRDREPELYLSIRDHWYRVEALGADPEVVDRAYRLRKDDGQAYDVTESIYGPACDCPDFLFRRDGIDPEGCKHVKALRKYGLVGPVEILAH